jgi:hypothetical protein
MSTITLRSVKGTALTNSEVDQNFTNLNTDKIEVGGDLGGNISTPIVQKIQSIPVANTAPSNNQILSYSTSTASLTWVSGESVLYGQAQSLNATAQETARTNINAANAVHGHAISDITNLQTTLNNKADTTQVLAFAIALG